MENIVQNNDMSSLESANTIINIKTDTNGNSDYDNSPTSNPHTRVLSPILSDDSRNSNTDSGFESKNIRVPIVGYEVIEERSRFTVYKLKVEDPSMHKSWLVFRRYTDFVRLDNKLRDANPNIKLPLPAKRFFKDNFETSFLEERSRCLQHYVNELTKQFPENPLVRDFLCLDDPPIVRNRNNYSLEQSIDLLTSRLKELYNVVHNCENCSKKLQQIQ